MAYHFEGNEIVIDGWELGISDNPYEGINDMRGVNIISVPGEVSVSFATAQRHFNNLTLSVTSADPATNIITATMTIGSLSVFDGQVIKFTGAGLPTGLNTTSYYWITYVDGTHFKVSNSFANFNAGTFVDITGDGTGTAASINVAKVTHIDRNTNSDYIYFIDSNGRVWLSIQGGYSLYLGNTVASTTNGNGICMYTAEDGTRYLFVFRNGQMDYYKESTGAWVYEWDPATGAAGAGVNTLNTGINTGMPTSNHETLIFPSSNKMYIADSHYVAALSEKAGTTFDPTNTATFVWSKQDLIIPSTDTSICLAPQGLNLLVGGKYNYIYSWDRTSLQFNNIIYLSENYVAKMITVNTNTYAFVGYRGRIYVTNSTQANFYTKIPDHIIGQDPIITWGGVGYNKNQIYFGVTGQKNNGDASTAYNGLWAVDITTNGLRVPNLLSSTTATVSDLVAYQGGSTGYGLFVAWNVGNSSYGVDISSTTPYTDYYTYIETEAIPVGQFLKKKTFENLEFKLAYPMTTQEGIRISYRTNKTASGSGYTVLGETVPSVSGITLSDFYTMNFDQVQWVQFKVEMKSVASNPSYVRLKELRLR